MAKKYFKEIDPKVSFPKLEEEIIAYWKENNTFEKSVDSRSDSKKWNFLDGPPFVTGMPHYGTLLSSLPKDFYARYWTMKGYKVRRVWGWDGHGLPIENKVEKKLKLERKKDIEEKIGVDVFIQECKKYVTEVSSEWEWYIEHIGRWVNFKDAYKTWNIDYMESVMWVFKSLYEKEYIYKGLRVSLFCPHCSTPISNFEVAMDADNYKEITEPANTYKYKLTETDNTYLLAWSTTPWNKIATPALAVNPKLTYIKVKQGEEFYILAKDTKEILNGKYEIVEEISGNELLGKTFEPHYDYYKIDEGKKAFVVIPGEFVTSEEGTGIVTIAAYGEDDLKSMKQNNIHIELHVNDEGHLKDDVPKWGGMYYLKANKLVNEDLKSRGLVYKEEPITHTIPNCWRCQTRLLHAPQDAWFVDVQKLKSKLEARNEHINWFPKHFKKGRFLNSLKAAPDWCISRSRYWGSPVPVWETPSGKRFVPGSIKELEELSGQKVTDLHKPDIDEIVIKDPETGEEARRVTEVLDSWIEAGSAAFAERHYPFGKETNVEEFFPPDFISEYTGQIRAWFYVLHVIAVGLDLLDDKTANIMAKNVLVTGVIKGSDGRKMSKNLGNYPDPKEMLEEYGGDALRLYLLGSSVVSGEDILISEEEYRNQVRGFLLPLWNVYKFFVTYSNLENWVPNSNEESSTDVLDVWITSKLEVLTKSVSSNLEDYSAPPAVETLRSFIVNDLSGWYIRRSRDRVGPEFYTTSYKILLSLSKLLAPLTPFVSEEIYRNLTGEESVHLVDWPKFDEGKIDKDLENEMQMARNIAELAHAKRKQEKIPVKQPLNTLSIVAPVKFREEIVNLIKDELNVLDVKQSNGDDLKIVLDIKLDENLKKMGEAREWTRKIQIERKNLGTSLDEYVDASVPVNFSEDLGRVIMKKALVRNLTFSEEFEVSKINE